MNSVLVRVLFLAYLVFAVHNYRLCSEYSGILKSIFTIKSIFGKGERSSRSKNNFVVTLALQTTPKIHLLGTLIGIITTT